MASQIFYSNENSQASPSLHEYDVTIRKHLEGHVTLRADSPESAIRAAVARFETNGEELPDMDDTEDLEFSIDEGPDRELEKGDDTKHDCFIAYIITRNTVVNTILDVTFLNCFETEAQAKASLQYEADICREENGEEAVWLNDSTLQLPAGYNESPDVVTTVEFDSSVPFHDRRARLISYYEDIGAARPSIDSLIEGAEKTSAKQQIKPMGKQPEVER